MEWSSEKRRLKQCRPTDRPTNLVAARMVWTVKLSNGRTLETNQATIVLTKGRQRPSLINNEATFGELIVRVLIRLDIDTRLPAADVKRDFEGDEIGEFLPFRMLSILSCSCRLSIIVCRRSFRSAIWKRLELHLKFFDANYSLRSRANNFARGNYGTLEIDRFTFRLLFGLFLLLLLVITSVHRDVSIGSEKARKIRLNYVRHVSKAFDFIATH